MKMHRLPTVREFMDTRAYTLSPDTDIIEGVNYLLKKHVTGAPVVDAKGQMVGILTELDCLKLLAAHEAVPLAIFIITGVIFYFAGTKVREEKAVVGSVR